MLTYVGRRARSSIVPLLIVFLGVFFLARLTGDPSHVYLPLNASADTRDAFNQRHGFDQPLYLQFWDYLGQVARLDFGESLRTGQDAMRMVVNAYPATLKLAALTMVLAVLGALVVGSWAAYRPNSLADRLSSSLAIAGASVPDFWIAIMGILVFAVTLGWLPTSGSGSAITWVLPVATLLVRPFGVMVQVTRGEMISALSAPYVKVARSKGASELRIIAGHVVRNAATPTLMVAGAMVVQLMNGAVVVETIFGWPGIGKLMIDSVLQRDFAVLQASVLVIALAIFAINMFIDVLHAVLDPRVRAAVQA